MTAHGPQIERACAVIDRAYKESISRFHPMSRGNWSGQDLAALWQQLSPAAPLALTHNESWMPSAFFGGQCGLAKKV